MTDIAAFALSAGAIGIGATAFMDLWTTAQKRLLGIPSLDYRLVGRWLGHMTRAQWRHPAIAAAPPIVGESVLGWLAHYAIGIAFAALLLALWGEDWARTPSLAPALIVGLVTVLVPFLIVQPAFGAGLAASRTPRPGTARLKSVVTHLSFGVGLFVAAKGWAWLAAG
jgi:fatty acid desaturase